MASFVLSAVAVQPGSGRVATEATGWSAGRVTSSFVVEAVWLSSGTRKATAVYAPWAAVQER